LIFIGLTIFLQNVDQSRFGQNPQTDEEEHHSDDLIPLSVLKKKRAKRKTRKKIKDFPDRKNEVRGRIFNRVS
jgi:hypothetical protein